MTTRVSIDGVRAFVESLFRAAGISDGDAGVCADAFVLQEMRGVKTHGLRRLGGMLQAVRRGEINPRPERRLLQEDRATAVIDGDGGLGILCCTTAMEHALLLAGELGIGFSIVVNSNHFLAAAPYCLRAAEQGAIGLAFANGNAGMAYPGTNVGALGNSPVGFALPTGAGFPIVFDAALTLSGGRLTQWSKEGTRIPDGFLGYDAEGTFTDDPAAVLQGGVPLPIGLHKGAGLGILIDVLTGVLGGTTFLRTVVPAEHPDWRRTTNTHAFIAIAIERFMPLDLFRERMAAYVADLKAKPLAPGYEEILLPGERAARSIEDCLQHGVPIEDDVLARLTEWAATFGVSMALLTAHE